MKELIIIFLTLAEITAPNANNNSSSPSGTPERMTPEVVTTNLPTGIQQLLNAYPSHLFCFDSNTILWKDGQQMEFDDGIGQKSFDSLLNYPDLEDQMAMPYTPGQAYDLPAENEDPGRIRHEPFFRKMYGGSKEEIEANLVTIYWMPNTVNLPLKVNRVNDVHLRLQAVSYELDQLPDSLKAYVINPAGTYNYRQIAGTNRLSMHSYGIAIDINIDHAHYWRWSEKDLSGKLQYRNHIPIEIVQTFEKHGFIWGGKWYHYDTMHFEYRPELIGWELPY